MRKTEEGIKGYLTPGGLFEELGLRYIGPIDGHNHNELIRTFNSVKEMNTPVLVHVHTRKGKGSKLAEKDAIKYYSIGDLKRLPITEKFLVSIKSAKVEPLKLEIPKISIFFIFFIININLV